MSKRIFVTLLLLVIGIFGANTPAAALPGDVNDDGVVDAQDLQLVINAVLGLPIEPYGETDMDVNNDGEVNALDIQLVINIILGLPVDIDDGELTPEERMALMDEAVAYFESLDISSLGIGEKQQRMFDWLEAHEDFPKAGMTDDDVVWAFFDDDAPVAFVDNYVHEENGEFPESTPLSKTARRYAASGHPPHGAGGAVFPKGDEDELDVDEDLLAAELPGSRVAEVVAGIESTLNAHAMAEHIRGRLEETGYELGPVTQASPAPSIHQLKQMGDLGVLVMTGHAGVTRLDRNIDDIDTGGDGQDDGLGLGEGFMIQTSAPFHVDQFDALLESDILTGRAVPVLMNVGRDEDGDPVTAWRWAITDRFIQAYVDFDDGVVALFGCNSFNEAFMNACFNKGASAFFGWDDQVSDGDGPVAFRHLFDRILGGVKAAEWDVSPVRSFDFTAVVREMDRHDIRTDRRPEDLPDDVLPDWEGGAVLQMAQREDGEVALLAPSIRNIRIDPIAGELHLHGLFGEEPDELNTGDAHVMVDFEMLDILEWNQWKVTCELPNSGPGSKGPVWITVNGVLSNIVMLTEYTGTALMEDGAADFRFRMPVQPFHAKPDWTPSVFLNHMEIGPMLLESPELVRLLARYRELDSVLHVPLPSPVKTLDFEHPIPIVGYFEEDSAITIHGVNMPPEMDRLPTADEASAIGLFLAFLDAITPPVAIGGAWAYPVNDEHSVGVQIGAGGIIETGDDEDSTGGIVPPWGALMDMNDYSVPGGTWESNGGMSFTWSTLTPEFPPDPLDEIDPDDNNDGDDNDGD